MLVGVEAGVQAMRVHYTILSIFVCVWKYSIVKIKWGNELIQGSISVAGHCRVW